MTKNHAALPLLALLLSSPLFAATLELPADARVEVQAIDRVTLSEAQPRRDDVLLRSAAQGGGTHHLPEYCVVIGDARLEGERLRLTAKALTCIETHGDEREIYSGPISAAAYDTDDAFGLAVCENGRCELDPERVFELRLASDLQIEEQDNPSERINEQRRQAEGAGVANPIPAERPDPDQ